MWVVEDQYKGEQEYNYNKHFYLVLVNRELSKAGSRNIPYSRWIIKKEKP